MEELFVTESVLNRIFFLPKFSEVCVAIHKLSLFVVIHSEDLPIAELSGLLCLLF